MVLFGGMIDVGIALMAGAVLAEYAKYREKRQQAFRLLAASGFLLLVGGIFDAVPSVSYFAGAHPILVSILLTLGEVVAIVAVVVLAYDVATERRKK